MVHFNACCSGEEDDDISEDLDAALRSLQALTSKVSCCAVHASARLLVALMLCNSCRVCMHSMQLQVSTTAAQ
jgi:hypothetical protein